MEVPLTQLHPDEGKVQRLNRQEYLLVSDVIMWKQINSEELKYLEISTSGEIRYRKDKKLKHIGLNSHGYPVIYSNNKEYLVHILVARTFIGDTNGKEVHHKDFNKRNPNVSNLMICARDEHQRFHASTFERIEQVRYDTDKYEFILTDSDVHKICKMLEKNTPFPIIRKKMGIRRLTDDMLSKITTGKNWTRISSQYNIPRKRRSCMNSYTKNSVVIGILMYNGYKVGDIAQMLGYELPTEKDKNRLYKAARRYAENYKNGIYGLFTNNEISEIIANIKSNHN